jgi:hypothetical protein
LVRDIAEREGDPEGERPCGEHAEWTEVNEDWDQ